MLSSGAEDMDVMDWSWCQAVCAGLDAAGLGSQSLPYTLLQWRFIEVVDARCLEELWIRDKGDEGQVMKG